MFNKNKSKNNQPDSFNEGGGDDGVDGNGYVAKSSIHNDDLERCTRGSVVCGMPPTTFGSSVDGLVVFVDLHGGHCFAQLLPITW